ncbi:hypothetical protein MKEN_00346000 [Mycena kentingensis (nom. inval.)]|nr:hypothetical protein MKEN_00346000 [Mycena kentingensis (nom. inval.)]
MGFPASFANHPKYPPHMSLISPPKSKNGSQKGSSDFQKIAKADALDDMTMKLDEHEKRFATMEQRMATMEKQMATLTEQMATLTEQMATLTEQMATIATKVNDIPKVVEEAVMSALKKFH